MGALPPMSDEAWRANFELYKQIPQYKLVNAGMTLEAYKGIFWWSRAHRLLGRLVGAAFAIPFVFFLVRRMIPRRLIWRCAVLFGLGGLQGLVGWWMVSSGLSERGIGGSRAADDPPGPGPDPVRGPGVDGAWTPGPARRASRSAADWRGWALGFLGAVFLQSLLGALVAGNDAGPGLQRLAADERRPGSRRIRRPWPLGHHRPQPGEQCSCTIGRWPTPCSWRPSSSARPRPVRAACRSEAKPTAFVLVGVVCLQAGLGIWTLMAAVPLALGVLHQAGRHDPAGRRHHLRLARPTP